MDRPIKELWPWAWGTSAVVWGLWGCWRVLDVAKGQYPVLSRLESDFRDLVPSVSWFFKLPLLFVAAVAYLTWVGLPLWLGLFALGLRENDQRANLLLRITRSAKESFGFVVGMSFALLVWGAAALFLALYGGLLDLLGFLAMIVFLAYSGVASWRGRRWQ